MGTFQRDEIMGIFKEERVFCSEHFEEDEMKQDNIITQSDLEDGETIYFCDECGERL
jgi:hypothetical protein